MRWPWRRRPRPFAGRDFLDLVPAAAVPCAPDPDAGGLLVLLPRFRDPVLARLLQPRLPAHRRWVKVRLDARGAVLWQAMDGRRTIRELVPVYEAAFPDDRTEAAERVCKWFYAGYESGLLTLV